MEMPDGLNRADMEVEPERPRARRGRTLLEPAASPKAAGPPRGNMRPETEQTQKLQEQQERRRAILEKLKNGSHAGQAGRGPGEDNAGQTVSELVEGRRCDSRQSRHFSAEAMGGFLLE